MGETASARSGTPEKQSFVERLVKLFTGGDDPEREKRRQLKALGKQLSKSKFKYYKPKSGEALPGLARLFYDIYRVVGPAQQLLQGSETSQALRSAVIEHKLSDEERGVRDAFADENIRALAQKMDTKQVAERVKASLSSYFHAFDASTVKWINETYNLVQLFANFARFDYYFVLRKFDGGFTEGDFSYTPRFDAINGEYVSDDLKDFLEVLIPLSREADWDTAFDVLHVYRGVDVVNRSGWKKLLSVLEEVRTTGILVHIVRHIESDITFQPTVRTSNARIVENYLNMLKTQVEGSIQKVLQERRGKKIDQLAKQVFGTTAVSRAKNYTEKANSQFTKRMLAGYTHTEAFNYLKAFLVDYFKRDVRVLVSDQLIVRGKWTDNVTSQTLSDAFHTVMEISQQLVEFDESLGEEGELGAKLKRAGGRVVGTDAASSKLLRQTVHEINEQVIRMINDSAGNLITIGKSLKMLIEDYQKPNHELLLNWKQIEGMSEEPLSTSMTEVYKHIYYFIQLLQMFVKK
jgi:hypothetical protein